jgi:transcription initiation factor TFIIIB Brf1 subunit/transcription initiation factor TFIIB
MTENTIRCPQCNSECVVEISNQKVCNQCGLSFDFKIKPTQRSERSRATGFGDPPKFASAHLIRPRLK